MNRCFIRTLCVVSTGVALIGQPMGARQSEWTYEIVHEFRGGPGGFTPIGGLIGAADGQIYGTTCRGTENNGAIYRLEADGSVTVLHSFVGDDGSCLQGLVQASDGNLYGATYIGDPRIFVMDLATSTFSVLHRFDGDTEGVNPTGSLVETADGFLYGSSLHGGTGGGCGTIYRIHPTGPFELVRTLSGSACGPLGSLVLTADGSFVFTTIGAPKGHVFRITADGELTLLHRFSGSDGAAPFAGVLLASDGWLYGTTRHGGIEKPPGDGTLFALDQDGSNFVSLHAFDRTSDGHNPASELIELSDGLYGQTTSTVFRMDLSGSITVLQGGLDNNAGQWHGPLLALDDNTLLGIEIRGGVTQGGAIFRLTRTMSADTH